MIIVGRAVIKRDQVGRHTATRRGLAAVFPVVDSVVDSVDHRGREVIGDDIKALHFRDAAAVVQGEADLLGLKPIDPSDIAMAAQTRFDLRARVGMTLMIIAEAMEGMNAMDMANQDIIRTRATIIKDTLAPAIVVVMMTVDEIVTETNPIAHGDVRQRRKLVSNF